MWSLAVYSSAGLCSVPESGFLTDSAAVQRAIKSTPPVTPESDDAALGEFLRQARERRGLTLQQISKETRIPWRHLDALEHDNLAAIPGGFYRRAEIRAYAEVVHLDQNLALARLYRALRAPATREGAP